MQGTGNNLAIPRIQLIKEFMKQIIIVFSTYPFILNDTKDIFSLGPICDQKLTFY